MSMILTVVGELFEAKKITFNNKNTGEVEERTSITIEQLFRDTNGDRIKRVEDYTLPLKDYELLKGSLDKYIVIYLSHVSWGANAKRQAGSMIALVDTLNFQIFDKNPFEQKPIDNKKSA